VINHQPPRAPELPTAPPEAPPAALSPVSPDSPDSPESPDSTGGPKPSADSPPALTDGERLIHTLRRDLLSHDVGRARLALDVAQLVPGAVPALMPLLSALVDSPAVLADPAGPALRERALRLLGQALAAAARPAPAPALDPPLDEGEDDDSYSDPSDGHSLALGAPPAPPPHRAEVVARLQSLAQTAPELALRLAAMDGLMALLPDSAPAVRAVAELALEGPELELKLRAVALLVALHQRG
jgi:hypothetical protein